MNHRAARILRPVSLALTTLLCLGCERSPPGPLSFTDIGSPAGVGSAQPRLVVGPEGGAVLSWLELADGDHALKYASLGDLGWGEVRTVAASDDWFVNWADTPSIVPAAGDLWAAHWLRDQPESFFAYDSFVAFSVDGGASWQAPSLLHRDGTETEHGFVTLFREEDGVSAVWLDGRNLIIDGEYLYEDADGNIVGTSLRYARFSATGERLESLELDELVCDCCLPDVALASSGPVLAYRDRTTEEGRDIVIRRMEGGQWQAPLPLSPDNWVIEACPINGPAIAAKGDSVAVAWFSAPGNDPYVRLALSEDSGRSFGTPVEIDAAGSFGHVDVAITDSGDAAITWLRSENDGVGLAIRRVSAAGLVGETQTVAVIDIGRPADFPQIVAAGDRLVFAWTEFEDGGTVKTAVAEFDR